jgi:hypothetical protein
MPQHPIVAMNQRVKQAHHSPSQSALRRILPTAAIGFDL